MSEHKSPSALFPGRETPTTIARGAPTPRPYDPNEDDPLDHVALSRSSAGEHSPYVIAPSIQLRSEFPTLTRTNEPSQPLTCIVVIELAGKRPSGNVPGLAPSPVMQDNYVLRSTPGSIKNNTSPHSSPNLDQLARPRGLSNVTSTVDLNDSPPEPTANIILREEDSPFSAITEDLRNRIIDWKGHPLSDLGPLQMYDLLSVRRETAIREFYVYLFKEAIICAVEEKKRGLQRLLSDTSSIATSSSRGVLRLKGRIYVRHIRNVTASSAAGEMSLTIDMEDEVASFILVFKERAALESWKNTVLALVNLFRGPRAVEPPVPLEEFGGSQKAMRMLSGSTMTTMSTVDSLLHSSAHLLRSFQLVNPFTSSTHGPYHGHFRPSSNVSA